LVVGCGGGFGKVAGVGKTAFEVAEVGDYGWGGNEIIKNLTQSSLLCN
jgi:hypothetical protein